jgi:class 3 adenylate cyclase
MARAARPDRPDRPDRRRGRQPALTGEQISAINRFPDDNPNPVLRVRGDGHVLYANPAAEPVLDALGVHVGEILQPEARARLQAAASQRGSIEVVSDSRTYAVWPVPIADLGFVNLYGMDVTAERAIRKFPDHNPHPVIRIGPDGRLLYANPASDQLVAALGLEVGAALPAALLATLGEHLRPGGGSSVEIEAGPRAYALLPIDVPEFGFVNVYGTDITAIRERERLARENERLLLSILPEAVAHRLRAGEGLIADRFEDATLLFADIVGFTQLSSRLSPAKLVGVLNDVFCAFDALVERHGLEKVKTIGDAYMVVGGITGGAADHTLRVARMALGIEAAVASVDTAVRLGMAFRVGIHCGPVVAGVVGDRRFIYDLWGDTVNLASRMESLGVPGRVQVTQAVKERLEGLLPTEPRGLIDVKGKGPTPAWLLSTAS